MNPFYYFSIKSFFFQIKCNQNHQILEILFIDQLSFPGESKNMPEILIQLKDQLKNGLEGRKTIYSDQNLDFSNITEKEKKVLFQLRQIPLGQTISYSELGFRSGFSKKSGRFIGNVMAKNPFPIIFPCHRVILNNGKIGNYTGGIGIKKFLLNQENLSF